MVKNSFKSKLLHIIKDHLEVEGTLILMRSVKFILLSCAFIANSYAQLPTNCEEIDQFIYSDYHQNNKNRMKQYIEKLLVPISNDAFKHDYPHLPHVQKVTVDLEQSDISYVPIRQSVDFLKTLVRADVMGKIQISHDVSVNFFAHMIFGFWEDNIRRVSEARATYRGLFKNDGIVSPLNDSASKEFTTQKDTILTVNDYDYPTNKRDAFVGCANPMTRLYIEGKPFGNPSRTHFVSITLEDTGLAPKSADDMESALKQYLISGNFTKLDCTSDIDFSKRVFLYSGEKYGVKPTFLPDEGSFTASSSLVPAVSSAVGQGQFRVRVIYEPDVPEELKNTVTLYSAIGGKQFNSCSSMLAYFIGNRFMKSKQ